MTEGVKFYLSDGPVNKGVFVLVDKSSVKYLSQWKWHLTSNGRYAARTTYCKETKKRGSIEMHIQIMGKREGFQIDHINGNKMDNRRSNLRFCTHGQNTMNIGKKYRNGFATSDYKGVSWTNDCNRWLSLIHFKKKRIYLGVYKNEHDAARAYNKAARELHGEFAILNEIRE
jgi:hypothetical protein